MPASLRRELGVKRGQPLLWERVSADECRVRIVRDRGATGRKSMRGIMKLYQTDGKMPKTTAGWLKLLREGERL